LGSKSHRKTPVPVILLSLACCGSPTLPGQPPSGKSADFYVSPTGDDRGGGNATQPFRSLGRARDAIRDAKRLHPDKGFVVLLRGGIYRIDRTMVFTTDDSGPYGASIIYAAYPGETPVITSEVAIAKWSKVTTDPQGLPPAAAGKLWVADLPASVRPFRSLYDSAGRLPRSRMAPFTPTKDYLTGVGLDRFTLFFPAGKMRNWPNLQDVEISIRPGVGWEHNLLPLESVDEAAAVARTAIPASRPMLRLRYAPEHNNEDGTVWVENVIEGLAKPGNWVVDNALHKLYLWPRDGGAPRKIVAPQLVEFIRVEGKIDYDGPTDTPVANLIFRGLTFTHGDRYLPDRNTIGWNLQHNWELFDRPSALVRLRGAKGVSLENCNLHESAGAGIRLDLYADQNRVVDSRFEHLGGVGILLAGYGPGTKYVNKRNQVLRNTIGYTGESLWASPAIFVWQSGENRIANNLIHHTPYTGIAVTGRIQWDRNGVAECSKTVRWKEVDARMEKLYPGGIPASPIWHYAKDALYLQPGREGAPQRVNWWQREMFLHGRYNIVERNDIHDVMQKLSDGNGIYISGAGRGNVVRANFVHDSNAQDMAEGIRCDDDQHDVTIEGNVIYKLSGMADGIAIKGVNYVLNNFLVLLSLGSNKGTNQSHRGYISLEESPVIGSRIEHNILYAGQSTLRPYYAKGFSPPDPRLEDAQIDYNLYYNTADPAWTEQHFASERKLGLDEHSAFGDPLFIAPDRGDFRFKPGSPAAKLGIEPIDMRQVGPPKN